MRAIYAPVIEEVLNEFKVENMVLPVTHLCSLKRGLNLRQFKISYLFYYFKIVIVIFEIYFNSFYLAMVFKNIF